jgi:hypothetical protein
MISAFGVEHGEISKGDIFANEKSPFGGGKWGPNATAENKKGYSRRRNASLVASVGGAGLFGASSRTKAGKLGLGLSAGGAATSVGNAIHGKKKGIAVPSRSKS